MSYERALHVVQWSKALCVPHRGSMSIVHTVVFESFLLKDSLSIETAMFRECRWATWQAETLTLAVASVQLLFFSPSQLELVHCLIFVFTLL